MPPVSPMLAKSVPTIPPGASYEPKWDGFRSICFRDGDEVELGSRNERPMTRYFPELLAACKAEMPERCVIDGEIIIATAHGLDFEALQQRIHPAASRINMLAEKTPAAFIAFDLLALGEDDYTRRPFAERRAALVDALAGPGPSIHVTPATTDLATAQRWFEEFEGAGLDGIVAKPLTLTYQPDKRVMFKIKHERDCDCVVAGFRWYKKGDQEAVGSLLLGLYDDSGALQHVGVCASFTQQKRVELVEFLAPYRKDALAHHPWKAWAGEHMQRIPGGQSRWSQGKDLSWEPLRPDLVVEVAYEHMQGSRFRHMAQFRRWRLDKSPRDCTYAQLEVVPPQELMAIFGT